MIAANDVSLSFGERDLLKEVSFRIGPHDRIGLVGSNGAGKTTLLKILLGEQSPGSGSIARAKYVHVGYLPQEGIHLEGRTLYDEAESVFGDIRTMQQDLEQINLKLAGTGHETEEYAELLEMAGELQYALEASDAFVLKSRVEKVLTGLGFTERDFARATDEFSGGWQMRIALAKLLLQQPSLLLLDEPTNHLDLDSLQWLEEYLRSYQGAVMVVSHDRRFLDTMTTRTFELSLGKLTVYHGNYGFYLVEKEERKTHLRSAIENQQDQIKQTERFIERFRYKATKARQVQSRIKKLEKMEVLEAEDEEEEIHFRFPPAPSPGRSVMELRGIRKSYGALKVFEGVDFDIDRGDRIAFVGVNGAGKSTLSRIIAGVEPHDGGDRKPGHNVAVSYFAQHQADELDPRKEVLQTLDEVAEGEIRKKLRTLLGAFLFRGDDVFKKVGVLSGGEKSRLALAKMLLRPSNLLVLDEPTNHLDLRSKGVLQEALKGFEGGYVIVSHDRDFLDPVVNKVVEFRRGRIRVFPGNVSDYIDRVKREAAAAAARPAESAKGQSPAKDRKRQEAEQRQRRYAATKPLQEKIEKAEREIARHEARKAGIEALLADPALYHDGEKSKRTQEEYREVKKLLEDGYWRWDQLTRELEKIRKEAGE
jgi:ATP-binding cassette subfamily F protein 3